MTHNNIVTELRPRRRLHPRLALYAITAPIGAAAALFDYANGGSAGLVVAVVGFIAWRFWPSAR